MGLRSAGTTDQRGRPFRARAGPRPEDQQSHLGGTVDRPVTVPENEGRLLTASRLLSPHGDRDESANAVPKCFVARLVTPVPLSARTPSQHTRTMLTPQTRGNKR